MQRNPLVPCPLNRFLWKATLIAHHMAHTYHIIPTLRFWKETWMYHEARAIIVGAAFLDYKGLGLFWSTDNTQHAKEFIPTTM